MTKANTKSTTKSKSATRTKAKPNKPDHQQPHRSLHVAAAQVHSGGGVTDVLLRIDRQAAAASILGAQIILFAEGTLHGYDYDMTRQSIAKLAQPLTGPDAAHLSAIAQAHGIIILAGMFEKDHDKTYNSMAIAWPDGRLQAARKHVLTKSELNAGLTPGPKELTIIEVNGVRCAIVICADCAIENLHEDLRKRHADYRLCPTGGGGSIHDIITEQDLQTQKGRDHYNRTRPKVFRPEAIMPESDCPFTGFASANALGAIGNTNFHQGHCMIVDNHRVMRAQIPGTTIREHAQDQLICVKLNFS